MKNFKFRGKRYITIEEETCDNCCFHEMKRACKSPKNTMFYCTNNTRLDKKNVIFQEYLFKFGK